MDSFQPRTIVTARIKPELRSAIAEVADKENMTTSHVVERAIVAWLRTNGFSFPANLADT